MVEIMMRPILTLFFIFIILIIIIPTVSAQKELNCPHSVNEVTINGVWGESEWDDAEEIPLISVYEDESVTGWIRIKNDEGYFYAIIDFTSTQILVCGDGAAIIFDTDYNLGDKPQKDDFRFYFPCEGKPSMEIGTGYQFVWREELPEGFIADMSFGPSPHSNSPHPIYEFRIPLSIFPLDTNQVGFTANAWAIKIHGTRDDIFLAWPRNSDYKVPDTWGEMNFPYPVPEFLSFLITIIITIVTSLFFLKNKNVTYSND
jgi:hypothetical protein